MIRSLAVIAVITLLVLICDNSDPDSLALIGFFVYVPIACTLAGIILFLRSYYLKKKGKLHKTTFRVGLIMIAIVIAIILLVFIAGVFAFPGQQ